MLHIVCTRTSELSNFDSNLAAVRSLGNGNFQLINLIKNSCQVINVYFLTIFSGPGRDAYGEI
jgi:hypothetical protein